jgi:hypothetical protein
MVLRWKLLEEGQILATWQGWPSCSSAENPVRKEEALWCRVKGGNCSALSSLSGSFGREKDAPAEAAPTEEAGGAAA